MTNRREFLQTTASITGSLFLPPGLFTKNSSEPFHFIHVDSGKSWSVADPVRWSLDNKYEPILERASMGLANLSANDGDRIIRLVTRRCSLNLIELQGKKVEVHYWGQQLADLRPFFKSNELARQDIEVVLKNRKHEVTTTTDGNGFLFGDPLDICFPLELFVSKWKRRFQNEADDSMPAPRTNSGFAWDGLEDGQIPWTSLKSTWRRSPSVACLNCGQPIVLVNFGLKQVSMFNRSPNFSRVCPRCQRLFVDDTTNNVRSWIKTNLDADFWPGYEMVWGKRVKLVSAWNS